MFPRDIDQQREWIYNEQVKTNELLTKMIESLAPKQSEPSKTTVIQPANTPKKRTNQRRKAQ